ncbi:MAG: limonene-1,2-epoxide hydrolase [Alphaproteobacteria bacterium]|nr:MAG: limonene-1,2-epoxide hydrolase [Alphaproteobacteria bacterium]
MGVAQEIVEKFLAHWNAKEINEACDMLSEDVDYHNIPMDPIKGREASRAFLAAMGDCESIDWKLHAIAENGDTVLTERTDCFYYADGRKLEIPLMGVFKVVNGEITEWRDYFDLGEFQRQMAGD